MPGADATAWARFRAYWLGLTISTIGDSFTLVALPIAAYTISRSSVLVGFVDMMEILSGVLLGSFLGIVADRSDSRAVMLWSDVVRSVMLAGLAVMAYSDAWNQWTVLIVAFFLGAFRAFHDGAESAMLATIIPPRREMQAFSRVNSAESISKLVGPFMGGLTLELGLWIAFGVDAMTFVVAAFIVLSLPRRERSVSTDSTDVPATPSFRSEFRTAIVAMRARPTYLALVGVGAFGNLAGLTTAGFFVPFASEVLHLTSVGLKFGLLLSLIGLGGLLANWITNRQSAHDPRTAGLGMVAVAVVVSIAGWFPSLATAIVAMVVTGAGIGYYQANYTAYRQRIFAPELLGRVSMVTRTVFYLTMMVGLGTGGVIAERLGPDRLLMIFGGISLIGSLVIGFIPIEIDPETGQTI